MPSSCHAMRVWSATRLAVREWQRSNGLTADGFIDAELLRSWPLPVDAHGDKFARGTAVYGGGSTIDTPVVIAGDSFYFLPTHEINAGAVSRCAVNKS